ncbi:hypothetical protein JCGZ_09087 [Jatropha curcas]|uniref:FBD domain-containing protein n=1 Tax=Jatropha curcas TaxID=180498 RepID=A0A067KUY2_JATCU|nr:hypothetical protein JCGZ_09087 [Jatropha curcas]
MFGSGRSTISLLKTKCLTIDASKFDLDLHGIVRLLRISPELEKLVTKFCDGRCEQYLCDYDDLDSYEVAECYLMLQKTVFTCLSSHLKTVEIIGLNASVDGYELVLNFVEFLLKNAGVLEKLIIYDAEHPHVTHTLDFVLEVSQKLLSFQRASPHAMIILFPK